MYSLDVRMEIFHMRLFLLDRCPASTCISKQGKGIADHCCPQTGFLHYNDFNVVVTFVLPRHASLIEMTDALCWSLGTDDGSP